MDCEQTHSGLTEMPWARLDYGRARHAQETPKSQHNEAQITLIFLRICSRFTRHPFEFENEPEIHFDFILYFHFFWHKFKFSVFVFRVLGTCFYAFAWKLVSATG